MNWLTRTVVVVLVAAITLAGLAAIYLLWEQDDETGEEQAPLANMEKFTPRNDGMAAPEITFEDGERHHLSLGDFHGQIVVLNFWATWCAPCIHELPSLDRLQAKLAPYGVKIIALSLDRGGAEAVKDFFADNGIHNLGIYVDPTMDAQAQFKIPGLPTTVLIDREGHDRGRLIGPADWSVKHAAELVLSAGKDH